MSNLIDHYCSESFWKDEDLVVMTPDNGGDAERIFSPDIKGQLREHVLFQTSGSSGAAKWVALSKRALLSSATQVCEHFEVWAGDVWGLCLPIYHVGGFGVLARSYVSGCGVSHFAEKWDASKAVAQMKVDGVTLLSLVPAQVVDIVNAGIKSPATIRAVIVGGGYLTTDLKEKAEALGWKVLPSYGMTETASQVATGDAGDGWIDTISGWDFQLAENGCLKVRGAALLTAYVEEVDGQWSVSDALHDGWFQTKDVVELGEDKIRVVRRADRILKILGELVDVSELEFEISDALKLEVILLEIPDERRGVKLVPVVERAMNSDEVEMLNGYSGLRALEKFIVLEDGFPRTPLGKIDRKAVRARVF